MKYHIHLFGNSYEYSLKAIFIQYCTRSLNYQVRGISIFEHSQARGCMDMDMSGRRF